MLSMSLTSENPVRKIAVELRQLRGGILISSKRPVAEDRHDWNHPRFKSKASRKRYLWAKRNGFWKRW